MGRLELTSDLLTGIDEIDQQHRSMYAWADRMLSGDPVQPAMHPSRAMTFLAGYVEYHFASEEFAMEVFGYPHALAHRIQHDGLRREVKALRDAVSTVGFTPALQERLRALFDDWLRRHIQDADRRFVQHLDGTSRPTDTPVLPEPQTLRDAGVAVPDDLDLRTVRVVHVPGYVPDSEVKARRRH